MNTTKTPVTKKTSKIPEVKHFYDVDAAKKVKRLAKKAMNSNFAKTIGVKRKAGGKKTGIAAALAAPVALQVGTFAVLAAGGYALWKNREKIQDLISGLSSDSESTGSMT